MRIFEIFVILLAVFILGYIITIGGFTVILFRPKPVEILDEKVQEISKSNGREICEKQESIFFLKTSKTGSTTLLGLQIYLFILTYFYS